MWQYAPGHSVTEQTQNKEQEEIFNEGHGESVGHNNDDVDD